MRVGRTRWSDRPASGQTGGVGRCRRRSPAMQEYRHDYVLISASGGSLMTSFVEVWREETLLLIQVCVHWHRRDGLKACHAQCK